MNIRIALAGNPNSGKTTLFNNLTDSNQYVGNWPGVTVEKKEGKLKKHSNVKIIDLPGIYSLSPYTSEEVVARNYLVDEKPEAILNIVDGTNLERNLYLSMQLLELGIPMVIALNMSDVVRKNGDKINVTLLSHTLGVPVVEISALKGENTLKAAEEAIKESYKGGRNQKPLFSERVEKALEVIEKEALQNIEESERRWYGVKLFERDKIVREKLNLEQFVLSEIEKEISLINEKKAIDTSTYRENIKRARKNDYWIDHYKRNRKIKQVSKDVLKELIEVIYVNKDGSIEIKFKYNDEYLELLNYLKTEGEKEKCLNGELEYI